MLSSGARTYMKEHILRTLHEVKNLILRLPVSRLRAKKSCVITNELIHRVLRVKDQSVDINY